MLSVIKIILGGYFLITGALMVAFHKDLIKIVENMLAGIPEELRRLPHGRSLMVVILVTGVASVVVGVTLLLMYFLAA
ncbi:MAG TPA: hypothetical protein VFH46_01620 [Pyrinomonadaceae bacterium]|nr:hypothetical protein [Pyrinomonadaceae bacterium]